jgi:hypothetical protein
MKISDLFSLCQGNSFELLNMQLDEKSNVNFVSRTSQNNGVVAKVAVTSVKPFETGLLTVALGGSVLSAFVQDSQFYTAFHIMVLNPKVKMTLEQKLFYCMIIKNNAYRYGYGRQANKTLKDIEIPSLDECRAIIGDYIVKPIKTKNSRIGVSLLNTTNWQEYKIKDLFTQERGKEKAPNQNDDGEVILINEIDNNNGFTRKVVPTKVFKGNAITVSINFAENVFYQKDDFCASVNIAIIKNKNLNKYSSLFIVSILKQLYKKYSYGFKISKEKIDNTIIKLPTDIKGVPDWQLMEDYIKSLPYSDII